MVNHLIFCQRSPYLPFSDNNVLLPPAPIGCFNAAIAISAVLDLADVVALQDIPAIAAASFLFYFSTRVRRLESVATHDTRAFARFGAS